MAELILDSNIRKWVFLPIVLITFLVGLIRHYVSILLASTKKAELQQIQDNQVMLRAKILRENGNYIPKHSFLMRKHFFNNEETGYFKTQKRQTVSQNPMMDPNMMIEMMKSNVTNVLPMIVIGGWINWTFSGFVTSTQSEITYEILMSMFSAKIIAADQTRAMQEQMTQYMAVSPDNKAAFKAEWEALELCEHHWSLKTIEQDMLNSISKEE